MIELAYLDAPERHFFWTAPHAESSELSTDDPLGLDYIAQQVGLFLLPTLTTRSSRAQAYAMVLYGLGLAERAVAAYGLPATDEVRRETFQRWERFWALATLESRGGNLPRGHWDAMRGVRGAKAAWFAGSAPLPLDFPLISRQQELGNLGAYLAPLRRSHLVYPGSLTPSLSAKEIVESFWGEGNARVGKYDTLALEALNPGVSKIERSMLRGAGERSRLTAIWARKEQADRLYARLFVEPKDDTTFAVSELVYHATRADVVEPRVILEEALASRFGRSSERLEALLRTALLFGDFMVELTGAFDRAYLSLVQSGFVMDHSQLAEQTFDPNGLERLARAAARLLDAPCAGEIRGLPAHGGACLRLAVELQVATRTAALDLVLAYHERVQRERRRGTGWISVQDGKAVLLVTTYTARATPRFPSYKLDIVRTLLTDLGKLPQTHELADAEVAS